MIGRRSRGAVAAKRNAGDIEAELLRITALPLEALREEWSRRLGTDPERIRSRTILLRMLAWTIQADTFGGIGGETEQRLASIGDKLESDSAFKPAIRRELPPGTMLNREWKGVVHTVALTAEGFQHLGKTYHSLSDIARAITGTRWSGPRFFKLEPKKPAENIARGAP